MLIKAGNGLGKPSNNTIGGTTPAARNLISGNFGAGVSIEDPFTDLIGPTVINNSVLGNLIGTDKNGTGSLGNGHGVYIGDASNNTVGGTAPGEANTIAFNSPAGVTVSGNGVGNRVLSNSIFSNVGMAIDLGSDGVTLNDTGDADTGANTLQNFPVITSATTVSGTTTINGTLKSRPRKTFTIQFFSNTEADASGNGEGETFLDEIEVKTNRKGKRSFTFSAALPAGENVVTATATNNATGDTSEFSNAVTAS